MQVQYSKTMMKIHTSYITLKELWSWEKVIPFLLSLHKASCLTTYNRSNHISWEINTDYHNYLHILITLTSSSHFLNSKFTCKKIKHIKDSEWSFGHTLMFWRNSMAMEVNVCASQIAHLLVHKKFCSNDILTYRTCTLFWMKLTIILLISSLLH